MNEHGLSIHMLAFPYAKHKLVKEVDLKPNMVEVVFVAMYIIGNYKTVKEVVKDIDYLNEIIYWPAEIPETPVFGQHYAIIDKNGDEVVMEFQDRKIVFKKNPIGVLTNSSPLEYHIENLRKYSHFDSNDSNRPAQGYRGLRDKHELKTGGQGMFGLPGDMSADSRFIRAAQYVSKLEPIETAEEGATMVFRLLHNIADIVPGILTKKVDKSSEQVKFFANPLWSKKNDSTLVDHTDTIIVNDLKNLKFTIKLETTLHQE